MNSTSDNPGNRVCVCATDPQCPAVSFIDNELLFVDYKIELSCEKCMSFGRDFICLHEARIELYRKYQI